MAKERKTSLLHNVTQQITADLNAAQGDKSTTKSKDRPVPAPSQLMHFSADYQRTVEELEALKSSGSTGIELALDVLDWNASQIGGLSEERVENLVNNLRSNPLSSAIVVRKRGERFEILAGRHRAEAFRRLGRLHILAIVREMSDDEAERVVVYDNFFAPVLSDYERYLALRQRRNSTNMSQDSLAEEAGLSQATVSRLFSFERLPDSLLELVERDHSRVSAKFVAAAVPLLEARPAESLAVFEQVVAGSIGLQDALDRMQPVADSSTLAVGENSVASAGQSSGGSPVLPAVEQKGTKVVLTFGSKAGASKALAELLPLLASRQDAWS